MPLDDRAKLVEQIVEEFQKVFDEQMFLDERSEHFEHMGHFWLRYTYCPLNYDIEFESDRDLFSIRIVDEEGASNELYAVEEYEPHTNIENVKKAVRILKKVLEKNDFDFYISRDNKLYRKNADGIKRIRDKRNL